MYIFFSHTSKQVSRQRGLRKVHPAPFGKSLLANTSTTRQADDTVAKLSIEKQKQSRKTKSSSTKREHLAKPTTHHTKS